MLPAVTATRYVTPLREGGSLPGLMEADDLGTYVVKWRAAGQGVKVLVARGVCCEVARAPLPPVAALVTLHVAPGLAGGGPGAGGQGLLQRAAGGNRGLAYLSGAPPTATGAGTGSDSPRASPPQPPSATDPSPPCPAARHFTT